MASTDNDILFRKFKLQQRCTEINEDGETWWEPNDIFTYKQYYISNLNFNNNTAVVISIGDDFEVIDCIDWMQIKVYQEVVDF